MIEQLLIASLRRYPNQAIPSVSSPASAASESCKAASINCNAAKEDFKHWIEFHNFLLQRMAYKTAEDTELYKFLMWAAGIQKLITQHRYLALQLS